MKYINQLEHPDIPYYTNVKEAEPRLRSVSKSGCGLCCVCMMLDILTDKVLDIRECVKISEACVANHKTGTDMNVLGPVIAEKFDIEYSKTSDLAEAIAHLQNGGQIIAHVGIPEGQEIGLFTKGGHYISLISTDGKEFCILDPSYTPEKFTLPERAGKVDFSRAPFLYCDVNTVDAETKPGRVKYHLFKRKN
ncbi:MAG: hypothetical protein E7612_07825 [Ruminococcaceae bacterium]|nr:hypothetical protein [Oscillospiraceae bacterium]